jgi:hypothetical protein
MGKTDQIEILYVTGSSRDDKGRRVVVCEGTVQNVIWPMDGVTSVDMKLLGITPESKRHIERFFLKEGQ